MKINISIIFLSLLSSLGLSACASGPTYIPFSAYKAGSVASQIINVNRISGWTALLSLKLPEHADRETYYRLCELADAISGGPSTPLKPRHGIRLQFTVIQIIGEKKLIIKDELIFNEPMLSDLDLIIGGFSLAPGKYIVSIRTLDDDPRLFGTNFALSVGTKWK